MHSQCECKTQNTQTCSVTYCQVIPWQNVCLQKQPWLFSIYEAPCFENILDLKFTPEPVYTINCLRSRENGWVTVSQSHSLTHSLSVVIPSVMLYLYKIQIRPKMFHCCHIWTEAAQSSLFNLDRVQNCFLQFYDGWLISHSIASLLETQHWYSMAISMSNVQIKSIL